MFAVTAWNPVVIDDDSDETEEKDPDMDGRYLCCSFLLFEQSFLEFRILRMFEVVLYS